MTQLPQGDYFICVLLLTSVCWSSGNIEERSMPYHNLDSGIIFALAIWFLAISIFAVMLLLAIAQIISENRGKMNIAPKTDSNRWDNLVRIAVNIFQRKK